jgi:tRNA pseudouridine55 synthase
MEKVLKLYKNLGETPLECLERFRVSNPEYANEKMTYAGRLDPMAEGLLIALVGEECKKKDEYLGLDKEYVFEVLFGFQSDTYDILGIPKIAEKKDFEIQSFVGKRVQEYPAYS